MRKFEIRGAFDGSQENLVRSRLVGPDPAFVRVSGDPLGAVTTNKIDRALFATDLCDFAQVRILLFPN